MSIENVARLYCGHVDKNNKLRIQSFLTSSVDSTNLKSVYFTTCDQRILYIAINLLSLAIFNVDLFYVFTYVY